MPHMVNRVILEYVPTTSGLARNRTYRCTALNDALGQERSLATSSGALGCDPIHTHTIPAYVYYVIVAMKLPVVPAMNISLHSWEGAP